LKLYIRFPHAACILHVHSLPLPSSSNLSLCSSHTVGYHVAHPERKISTSLLYTTLFPTLDLSLLLARH
jgi:hypothetical protein